MIAASRPVIGVTTQTLEEIPDELPRCWIMSQRYVRTLTVSGAVPWIIPLMDDPETLRAIYDRHTRQHHQYFTDNEMTVSKTREWRIIFFPWRALFTFMAFGAPFALALGAAVNPNAGYILMVTIISQYTLQPLKTSP